MNYTYMKGCALCMTLCLTSAALPGMAKAESSAIVSGVLQSSVIKGVVKDSNGEPLLGVNVLVKGTTIGAVTDIDGNFSFEAPAGSTLVGFLYRLQAAGNKSKRQRPPEHHPERRFRSVGRSGRSRLRRAEEKRCDRCAFVRERRRPDKTFHLPHRPSFAGTDGRCDGTEQCSRTGRIA